MHSPRCGGILLHPTSLPGAYGVGTLDGEAHRFVEFLAEAGQSLWQVLPLGPTSYGDSPYQSFSTYAGNPNLLGLEAMRQEGLVTAEELAAAPPMSPDRVDYERLYRWKLPLLKRAAARFWRSAPSNLRRECREFCLHEAGWLDDYALFMAIKEASDQQPWSAWPEGLRSRHPDHLAAARARLEEGVQAHRFIQWVFARQWADLKAHAVRLGVRVVGDLPIFVAMDSADAWVHARQLLFDRHNQPTAVAGVPPDYFSESGQLWGNPLYRWDEMRADGYRWWRERIAAALDRFDLLRIDHFRGFAAYWEVPAGASTAVHGRWVPGPGAHFFSTLEEELGSLPLIAEDLGEITPDVHELRERFGFPGMKVLQFAFGGGSDNPFLPHHHRENFVVYTGTHDNDTTVGWYEQSSREHERDHLRRYLSADGRDVAWTVIRAAWASVARWAVAPMQDVLGLGTEARMNLPGQGEGNWRWRCRAEALQPRLARRLREVTELYGREPRPWR